MPPDPTPPRNGKPVSNPYPIVPCVCGGKHPSNYKCPKAK